jgi:hypothetical protein
VTCADITSGDRRDTVAHAEFFGKSSTTWSWRVRRRGVRNWFASKSTRKSVPFACADPNDFGSMQVIDLRDGRVGSGLRQHNHQDATRIHHELSE